MTTVRAYSYRPNLPSECGRAIAHFPAHQTSSHDGLRQAPWTRGKSQNSIARECDCDGHIGDAGIACLVQLAMVMIEQERRSRMTSSSWRCSVHGLLLFLGTNLTVALSQRSGLLVLRRRALTIPANSYSAICIRR